MTDTLLDEIAKKRTAVLEALCAAATPPPSLIAVSKVQPDERIDAMLAAGQRVFGENRVQEAYQHWQERRANYPELELHLIGPLQTNKSDEAVALFDVIETLDREKLAAALQRSCEKLGKYPEIFIQVNTGDEPQKAGVSVSDLKPLLRFAKDECGLNVTGLMCIPPVDEPAGPHFALLARLAETHALEKLSMGMSGDYEIAARFGATHVRVGSALFGERSKT